MINEEVDLNVRFSTETRCNEPTVWRVDSIERKMVYINWWC
ncbi:hypothetical protein CUMW_274190 [Citrus unshiu]|uniref:Uncharacterized protein n=1 Tax=Citrus unshiu TaxID=55188 RepID=A0A2H5MXM0_CITUN|nr:hypothetical protein CUMW_274190 [Citrus unshiu]